MELGIEGAEYASCVIPIMNNPTLSITPNFACLSMFLSIDCDPMATLMQGGAVN
jgi:hypothetical protein